MRDITTAVRAANARSGAFGADERRALLQRVSAAVEGWAQWDESAGEEWASVLQGADVVAFVCMDCPLILHTTAHGAHLQDLENAAVLIPVDDLNAPMMCAERGALVAAFNEGVLDSDFDASRFSAEDLWFATHW